VTVEFLYWEGCPSCQRALSDLRTALGEVGLDPDELIVREVCSEEQAATESFVGSPTIRIDGVDLQPTADEPTGLTCRIYRRRDGRIAPTPDPADLRDALLAAARPRAGG
jgi:hypothetical protein